MLKHIWQDTTIEIPIKCKLIVKLPFSDPCAHVLQINLGNSPFSMVKPPGLMLFLKHFTHSHGHSKGIQNHPKASKSIKHHPKSSKIINFIVNFVFFFHWKRCGFALQNRRGDLPCVAFGLGTLRKPGIEGLGEETEGKIDGDMFGLDL